MPRTRNITREQWQAAVSSDNTAAVIRSLGSIQHHRNHSHSSVTHGGKPRSSASIMSSLKENEREEDRALIVDEKDRVLGERKGRQRPLQDITDTVVHPNRPSEMDDNPKGKKRAKRAHHEVSSQLTSLAKRQTTHNARFPSSLPPSSPPPPSNEQPVSGTRPHHEAWEEEDIPVASDGTESSHNSDPFGFFAVERELKTQRNRRIEPRGAGGLVPIPASSPFRLTLDAVGACDTQDPEEEEEMISPCATPPTPHKKKRRQRAGGEGGALLFSPRTESLPSSPSPLKLREPTRARGYAQDRRDLVGSIIGRSVIRAEEDEDDGGETVTETAYCVLRTTAKDKGVERAKPQAGRKAKTRGKRRRESKTPSDPMEFAQRLVDRLPKRRRKRVKGEEATDSKPESRRTRQKRTGNRKTKGDESAAAKGGDERDREREAILTYYEQLEAYSMLEEKVYVI